MEQRLPRPMSPMVWVGLGLTLALLLLAFLMVILKIRSVQHPGKQLPELGTVAAFTLTNQNGVVTTQSNLLGKVWVADIIFTRCAGPCLRMSAQMTKLQEELPKGDGTMLVSLTTDPDFDTPEVLKTYAARFDADPDRWVFLTGTKKQIADLASGSLKLAAVEKSAEIRENPEDLFIHSTIFVVVDKHLRLRAIFETEGPGLEPEQVRRRILNAVAKLEREA